MGRGLGITRPTRAGSPSWPWAWRLTEWAWSSPSKGAGSERGKEGWRGRGRLAVGVAAERSGRGHPAAVGDLWQGGWWLVAVDAAVGEGCKVWSHTYDRPYQACVQFCRKQGATATPSCNERLLQRGCSVRRKARPLRVLRGGGEKLRTSGFSPRGVESDCRAVSGIASEARCHPFIISLPYWESGVKIILFTQRGLRAIKRSRGHRSVCRQHWDVPSSAGPLIS